MKYFFRNCIGIIGVLIICLSLGSQSEGISEKQKAINALERCSRLYLDLKKFSIDVEYSIFYDAISFDTPADSEKGIMIRKNGSFYKEEFDNISLVNDTYQLKIDKQSEMIIVREKVEGEGIPTQVNYDSLSTYVERVEKIKDGYSYYLNLPTLAKMDVLYSSNGYLHTLRNHYRDPMNFGDGEVMVIAQITYTNFERNPKIDPSLFSEKEYIDIDQNGGVKAKGEYEHFQILNYLTPPKQ